MWWGNFQHAPVQPVSIISTATTNRAHRAGRSWFKLFLGELAGSGHASLREGIAPGLSSQSIRAFGRSEFPYRTGVFVSHFPRPRVRFLIRRAQGLRGLPVDRRRRPNRLRPAPNAQAAALVRTDESRHSAIPWSRTGCINLSEDPANRDEHSDRSCPQLLDVRNYNSRRSICRT